MNRITEPNLFDGNCNVYYDDDAEMERQPMKYIKHRNVICFKYKDKVSVSSVDKRTSESV